MKRLLKSKKGLSTVVTTLIILVISVLLATVVTYYAMNMVSTRVIQEDGRITQLHIWVDTQTNATSNETTAQAALFFKNTGGRDVLLDKVTVRYQDIPWTDIYYAITTDSITTDMNYQCLNSSEFTWGTSTGLNITSGAAQPYSNLTLASADIALETGQTIILYMSEHLGAPDTVDSLDIGTPVPIGIHTSNAIYYKEVNVQALG